VRTATLPGYDRTPLFLRAWPARGGTGAELRGAVVLVHGYAEHSGRYDGVARALTEQGLTVYAYDQRGHGRSGGPTALPRAFDEYVADLHAVVRHARSEHPAVPLFLMGHSMGGAVILLYVLEHGAAPAGLVLSSPMIRLPTPRLLQRAAEPLGRLAPALPTAPPDPSAISRDPAVVEDVTNDPLCYSGFVKARTGAAMGRATRRLDAQMHRLALPFFVFHGTADRLTEPAGSRALARRARSTDKTLRLYDGFYHESFRDPGGERILTDVADWLGERA
jgi:alpha-beta hydrolase superfamily lysophospholipase